MNTVLPITVITKEQLLYLYDVSYSQVYSWVRKYDAVGEDGLSDKRGYHKTDDEIDELERLRREVLLPAQAGQPIMLRAYRCAAGDYAPPVTLPPAPITILEGSYSCHPALRDYYDLTLFVTCPPQEQARRLRVREGERAAAFFARWIPLEEGYFARDEVQAHCNYTITTEEST